MKCIELASPSSLDTIRVVEREVPRAGPGEVLMRVHASSLNFHDYLVATNIMPAPSGRIPLSDGAGEVVELGEGVTRFAVGDRVTGTYFPRWIDGPPTPDKISVMRGEQCDGFAAEYVAVDAETLTRTPANLSDVEAATLPCAGLTAWRALFVEASLAPGDTILIEGSGGVSLFALQLARMAGANVVAVTSTPEKMEKLRLLGAAHVLNYREQPEWGKAVTALTGGRGVDYVVEVVGGDLTQSLTALRLGGRSLLIGALSRQPITYRSLMAIAGNRSVTGLTVASRADQEKMFRAIEISGLKPVIDRTFGLEELADAFRHQASGTQFGKIALAW
ncbi:zinc-dependent alcohol dehydrogenase family protein [Flavisphingomonas formosensis]|uniref:zinc-dependent alcohol dehydrogenase family protein n=1 Tax=Flavisphingomonas formosensis TaxID=861534 RepID=UPI0012FAD910|nr:NAD(P)-dependent alcohol dehydrogenase [Sphingomonas formosensis]